MYNIKLIGINRWIRLKLQFVLFLVFCSMLSNAQKLPVRGKIVDQTGKIVSGAFIKEKGTLFATISNKDGEFTFHITNLNASILISKIGYLEKEISLKGNSYIIIKLIKYEETNFIISDKLTLGGIGSWKEENVSGSISQIVLEKYHNSERSVGDLLQIMPGLVVKNERGEPGGNQNIWSRGNESLLSSQPLVIVDGVLLNTGINMPNIYNEISSLASINVKDIKRIEVLRDAASTAIYGSRGANGVIYIETYRGKRKSFNVKNHTQLGVDFPLVNREMMSANPYFELINESLITAGREAINFPENTLTKDWQKEIFQTGFTVNHNLALEGGGEKSTFYLSGNVEYINGILQKEDLSSGGLRINYSSSIFKWLDVGLNANYTEVLQKTPVHYENQFELNPYNYASQYPPISKQELEGIPELSNFFGEYDPIELINEQKTKNQASFLLGGFNLTIKFSKHLSFHSNVAGDYSYFTENAQLINPKNNNTIHSQKSFIYNWEINSYLKYQKLSGKSNWLFLLGANEIYLKTNSSIHSQIIDNTTQIDSQILDFKGKNSRRIDAQFTKLNYSYNERFDLSASFRREKILNQGGVDQFGLFPAFSAGIWLKKANIDDESIFTAMKLFSGWGIPGANRFYALNYFEPKINENYLNSLVSTNLSAGPRIDPNVRWETVEEWNMGFRTEWLNSDLKFNVTYFDRLRKNVTYLTSNENDNTLQWNHSGRVHSSWYEMDMNYKKDLSKIGLFIGFNMQINSSKVLSLDELNSEQIGFYPENLGFSSPLKVFKQGAAPGVFWGYVKEGIVQEEPVLIAQNETKSLYYRNLSPEFGDVKFKDFDGNGIIDENDMSVIGNPNPDVTYTLNGGIIFDRFDFVFVMNGVSGVDVFNLNKTWNEASGGFSNRSVSMTDRWTFFNPSATLPRVHFYDPNNNNRPHSGMIEDASFFRIKRIELGHYFSFKNGNKNRVYISAYDILTITPYNGTAPYLGNRLNSQGLDYGLMPAKLTLMVGLQLGI